MSMFFFYNEDSNKGKEVLWVRQSSFVVSFELRKGLKVKMNQYVAKNRRLRWNAVQWNMNKLIHNLWFEDFEYLQLVLVWSYHIKKFFAFSQNEIVFLFDCLAINV